MQEGETDVTRIALFPLLIVALAAAGCQKKPPVSTARPAEPPPERMDVATPDPYAADAMAPTDTAGNTGRMTTRVVEPAPAPNPRTAAATTPQSSSDDDEVLAPARSTPKKSTAGKSAARGNTYTVKKGDTLTGIALKVYGDANRWDDIWRANKARVPNKDKLKVGTKLIIP
jgi:nucleoid-associated protein YgaU